VSKIKALNNNYEKFISIPWRDDAAAAQRVIFCIYNENDELKLRYNIEEFEISTKRAGHHWVVFDITDTFAEWLSSQRYAKSYFEKPELLSPLLGKYLAYLKEKFQGFLIIEKTNEYQIWNRRNKAFRYKVYNPQPSSYINS
jgi:hypothetical protein